MRKESKLQQHREELKKKKSSQSYLYLVKGQIPHNPHAKKVAGIVINYSQLNNL